MKKIKLFLLCIFISSFIVNGIEVKAKTELTFPIHIIQKNAPDNESNVIVFFGDGFTDVQQDKFLEEVRKKVKTLMEIEPFKSQKDSFNIYAMQVVSREEGAGTLNSGIPAPDTYFKTQYNYAGIDRLLFFTGDGGNKVNTLMKEVKENYLDPGGNIFHATVITNSNKYGGSGGNVSVTSLNNGTNTMILHEAAHGFAGLRDEYWMPQGEGPNKTQNSDLTTIKWKEFVGFRGIGAFPYGNSGDPAIWYKPVKGGCLMETLYSSSFCEVCKHEVFSKINLPRISIYEELYIAKPIFTFENTGTEVNKENGLLLKDNNIDFRTVIHNYTSDTKTITVQIKIKEGDTVVKTLESDEILSANSLLSVQRKINAIATANANYSLEFNIYDKLTNKLLSTNMNTLDKVVVPYNRFLGNDTYTTTTQLPDVDKSSVNFQIGQIINPVGPDIYGYTYRGSNAPLEGILVRETNQSIDFYYTKNEGNLHLIYKNQEGTITKTDDKKIAYGEMFVPQLSDVPQVENYDIVLPSNATYDGIEDITLTYEYTKSTKEVWVEAIDKSTNTSIGKISIGMKEVGEQFTLQAPTKEEIALLENYDLDDMEEKQVQLLNDKSQEVITFYFNKKKDESIKPDKPDVPVEPDGNIKPDKPDVPVEPDESIKPDKPEIPVEPDESIKPDKPEISVIPGETVKPDGTGNFEAIVETKASNGTSQENNEIKTGIKTSNIFGVMLIFVTAGISFLGISKKKSLDKKTKSSNK